MTSENSSGMEAWIGNAKWTKPGQRRNKTKNLTRSQVGREGTGSRLPEGGLVEGQEGASQPEA